MSANPSPEEAARDAEDLLLLRRRVAELEQGIRERDQALAALRRDVERLQAGDQERQRLTAVVEGSLDFIGLADAEGHAVYVNAAGRRMVGLDDMADAQRSAILEYFLPEDVAYSQEHILPVVARGGFWQGDYRFRHFKTGAPIPVHYTLFAISDKDTGALIGFGTVTRDISDLKRAEAEQMRLKDEIIRIQSVALAELSTPLIPISEEVVVMPLIGMVDSRRAEQVMDTLLRGVVSHRAQTVILDITGVTVVDSAVADALMRAAKAVRLLGAQTVLTGISPNVAQTLVNLGIDFEETMTRNTLQSAIAWATSASASQGKRARPARSGRRF